MLENYRRILAVPGGLRFSAAAFVGRLPESMMGIGIVLLVVAGTGSYGLAGTVSAGYTVANAVLAIAQGRFLDRWGQARVLVPAALLFAGSSALLVAASAAGWPSWTACAVAAVAGATLPATGACVRARWSHALHGRPEQLQTAFALEAAVDEMVFMTGPIVVTLLATAVDPAAGVGVAVLTGLLGTLALAVQRGTEPPVEPRETSRRNRPPLPWRTLLPVLGTAAALGCLFGAAEVVTVAWADEHGSQAYAGPLLALWALGSLVAGVVTGAVRWRHGPARRLRVGAWGMCVAMAPLAVVDSVPVMGLVLLVGGLAIAPTLIAATSLTQQVVPPRRLTEGMMMLQTGIVAGVAPGTTVGGVLVDQVGASAAYVAPFAAGALAALSAQALPRNGSTAQ